MDSKHIKSDSNFHAEAKHTINFIHHNCEEKNNSHTSKGFSNTIDEKAGGAEATGTRPINDTQINFVYINQESEQHNDEPHRTLRRLTAQSKPVAKKLKSKLDEVNPYESENGKKASSQAKEFSQDCFKDMDTLEKLEIKAKNLWVSQEILDAINIPMKKIAANALAFEESALDNPLLKDLSKENQAKALDLSDLIFNYLDLNAFDSLAEVKKIIEFMSRELADEVILQIFKQLNSNPLGLQVLKLHKLYSIIVTYYPPSATLFKSVVSHFLFLLESNTQYPEMSSLIKYNAFRTVTSFYNEIPRLALPVEEELLAVETMKKIPVDVYLLNEGRQTFFIESFTTIEQLRRKVALQFDLHERLTNLGIMLSISKNGKTTGEYFLNNADYVLDILADMSQEKEEILREKRLKQPKRLSLSAKPNFSVSEKEFSFKLYLCVDVYYKLRPNDVDAISLFYMQQKREVRAHSFPLSEFDIINLCSLELLIEKGPCGPDFEVSEEMIVSLLPDSMLKLNHPEVWCDPINCCYLNLSMKGKSQSELKFEYLSILEKYDLFCSRNYRASYRVFEVDEDTMETPREKFKKQVLLGIKPLVVIIADLQSKKTLYKIEYKNIYKWGTNMNSIFTIYTDDNNMHLLELEFADEVDHLMTEYTHLALGTESPSSSLGIEFANIELGHAELGPSPRRDLRKKTRAFSKVGLFVSSAKKK